MNLCQRSSMWKNKFDFYISLCPLQFIAAFSTEWKREKRNELQFIFAISIKFLSGCFERMQCNSVNNQKCSSSSSVLSSWVVCTRKGKICTWEVKLIHLRWASKVIFRPSASWLVSVTCFMCNFDRTINSNWFFPRQVTHECCIEACWWLARIKWALKDS